MPVDEVGAARERRTANETIPSRDFLHRHKWTLVGVGAGGVLAVVVFLRSRNTSGTQAATMAGTAVPLDPTAYVDGTYGVAGIPATAGTPASYAAPSTLDNSGVLPAPAPVPSPDPSSTGTPGASAPSGTPPTTPTTPPPATTPAPAPGTGVPDPGVPPVATPTTNRIPGRTVAQLIRPKPPVRRIGYLR